MIRFIDEAYPEQRISQHVQSQIFWHQIACEISDAMLNSKLSCANIEKEFDICYQQIIALTDIDHDLTIDLEDGIKLLACHRKLCTVENPPTPIQKRAHLCSRLTSK